MVNDNDKIIYYAQAYLSIVKEANSSQISGFLMQAPFKFQGSQPSNSKVGLLLAQSSLFDSKKNSAGFSIYTLKK